MWCYAYITLFAVVLGWTDSSKVRTFSMNFGGQHAFNWEMNDPLRGISRLVSGNTEPVGRKTETITPVHTTEKVPIETTTLPAQPTIEVKPTIDYSNRKPVEEEKFKKVHAFVLCVVQDGYNCGKELGDIDITKHLGPPPNVTDEKQNNSRSNIPEITEKYNDSQPNTPGITENYDDSQPNIPEITENYDDSQPITLEMTENYNDSQPNTLEITETYNDSQPNTSEITEKYLDLFESNTPEITEKYNDSQSNTPEITEKYLDLFESNTPEITEEPSIDHEKNTFRIIAGFLPDETTTLRAGNDKTTVQESVNKVTRTYKGTLKKHKKTTIKSNEQGTTDIPWLEMATSNEYPELPQTITTVPQKNLPTYTENTFLEENPATVPTFLDTTGKDGIFPDYKPSFDQLQVHTIHHFQTGVTKFLPASWIEYDSVLQNLPYSTTPQPENSFTTTRTTRDVNEVVTESPSTSNEHKKKEQSHKHDSENDKEDESNVPGENKDKEVKPVSETDDKKDDTKIVPSVKKLNSTGNDDKGNKTTTKGVKPKKIENNSNDTDSKTHDKHDKTTTEDGDKDSEEKSDKDSSEKEEDKTKKEVETDDDKVTSTKKIDKTTTEDGDKDSEEKSDKDSSEKEEDKTKKEVETDDDKVTSTKKIDKTTTEDGDKNSEEKSDKDSTEKEEDKTKKEVETDDDKVTSTKKIDKTTTEDGDKDSDEKSDKDSSKKKEDKTKKEVETDDDKVTSTKKIDKTTTEDGDKDSEEKSDKDSSKKKEDKTKKEVETDDDKVTSTKKIDKTTTEDGDKDSEEKSDKDSTEKEEDKTEKEEETDDDKVTSTKKIDESDVDDTDDYNINIDPIEFDDDFDDTMITSSSDRIMNKASDETSATVPVIIYATPNGETNYSVNILHINNKTYEYIGTTSTEISVVTEVSVQRNPKPNINSNKDSETVFTKAKKSLYSLLKFAKELDVD